MARPSMASTFDQMSSPDVFKRDPYLSQLTAKCLGYTIPSQVPFGKKFVRALFLSNLP